MLKFAFLTILLLGGSVMAKDGTIQAPRGATAPIDEEEQFWNSEEGQDIDRMFQDVIAGKKSLSQAREDYNKKWADKPISGAQSVPNAPVTRIPGR